MFKPGQLLLIACMICLSVIACQKGIESDPAWQPKKEQILSKWALEVTPENAWQSYPRPGMERDDWKNLNGLWAYAITSDGDSKPEKYAGSILVPFPVESALSGVQKTVGSQQFLWYQRTFQIPTAWENQHILLHFEAVDWEATVWVNNTLVGSHRGGYDPFDFNITNALAEGENQITIRVFDPTDEGKQPIGKQTKNPQGIYYTPSTGIWQTVWLEPVSATYFEHIKTTPNTDLNEVTIGASVKGPVNPKMVVRSELFSNGELIARGTSEPDQSIRIKLKNPKLWTPDHPKLYDLKLTLELGGQIIDQIGSYFGMRKVSLEKDLDGFTKVFLNDTFIFQNGPLDQGFWPGGIYTPPSMEAMKYDLQMIKSMGFNMLRKHVKIEPRSFYYWCDVMGLLVWQDMPNGDKKISPSEPDIVRSKESAEQFEYELSEMIRHLYNHPSIIMWVPFNEGWGQYKTSDVVKLIKSQDQTRLVNNASGWSDRGVGDVLDLHHYPDPICPEPESDRAIVLGEFGGLGLPVSDHLWNADHWGYQNLKTNEELVIRYEQLYDLIWNFQNTRGLSACVYTQITDVEGEVNGLLTYDRAKVKVKVEDLYQINTNQYLSSPRFEPEGGLFNAGESVRLYTTTPSDIRYTTDGTEPTAASPKYVIPIELVDNVEIKAKTFQDEESSRSASASYQTTKMKRPKYTTQYSEKYRAGGDFGLLDGVVGSIQFADGNWQGFHGENLEVIIDLGEARQIDSVSFNFLEDTRAWIFHPKEVSVFFSMESQQFTEQFRKEFKLPADHTDIQIHRTHFVPSMKQVRFIKIQALNIQTCPSWHDGAGGKSWIFIDEVILK